jgi:hypothetical protein
MYGRAIQSKNRRIDDRKNCWHTVLALKLVIQVAEIATTRLCDLLAPAAECCDDKVLVESAFKRA